MHLSNDFNSGEHDRDKRDLCSKQMCHIPSEDSERSDFVNFSKDHMNVYLRIRPFTFSEQLNNEDQVILVFQQCCMFFK